MKEIKNAIITSTSLGIEDHGCLTLMVFLEYGIGGQGFGGYALDEWSERKKRRIGTAYGCEYILRLLNVLGVDSLEKLNGKSIRVEADNCKIYRVGHFLKDKWFDPEEVYKEFC